MFNCKCLPELGFVWGFVSVRWGFAGVRWGSFWVRLGSFWVRTFNSANQQRGARNLNVEKFVTQSSERRGNYKIENKNTEVQVRSSNIGAE